MFDQFCTVKEPGGEPFSRQRPKLESLYDVFVNVRNDEKEHWKTLCKRPRGDAAHDAPPRRRHPQVTSSSSTTCKGLAPACRARNRRRRSWPRREVANKTKCVHNRRAAATRGREMDIR